MTRSSWLERVSRFGLKLGFTCAHARVYRPYGRIAALTAHEERISIPLQTVCSASTHVFTSKDIATPALDDPHAYPCTVTVHSRALPSQVCGAIFDAILVHIVSTLSPNKWQVQPTDLSSSNAPDVVALILFGFAIRLLT